jgi:hypothetical protein
MKLAQIHQAVNKRLMVRWQNREYEVIRSSMPDRDFIRSTAAGLCIGLTWADWGDH